MRNLKMCAFLICSMFFITSCTTMHGGYGEPLDAQSFSIDSPAEDVFNNIKLVMREAGYKIVQVSAEDRYLVVDGVVDFVEDDGLIGRADMKNRVNRYYLRYIFIVVDGEAQRSTLYIRGLMNARKARNMPISYSAIDFLRRTIDIWGEEIKELSESNPSE